MYVMKLRLSGCENENNELAISKSPSAVGAPPSATLGEYSLAYILCPNQAEEMIDWTNVDGVTRGIVKCMQELKHSLIRSKDNKLKDGLAAGSDVRRDCNNGTYEYFTPLLSDSSRCKVCY